MKKAMVGFMLILGMGVTSQVNAQSISAGIKAEGNLSNFILSDMDGASSNLGLAPPSVDSPNSTSANVSPSNRSCWFITRLRK